MLLYRRLIADLLEALAGEKYPFGTSKLLQVEELLRQLPSDTPPEALRTLLAPLFASTPQEQAHFYELFDRQLTLTKAALAEKDSDEPANAAVQAAVREEKKYRYWALSALLPLAFLAGFLWDRPAALPSLLLSAVLLTGGIIGWRLLQRGVSRLGFLLALALCAVAGFGIKTALTPKLPPDEISKPAQFDRFAVKQGQLVTRPMPTDTMGFQYSTLFNGQQTGSTPAGSSYSLDSTGLFSYTAGIQAPAGSTDTICTVAVYPARRDTVYFIADILAGDVAVLQDTGLIKEQEVPFPRDLAALEIAAAAQASADFRARYAWPLKVLLWLMLSLALWALMAWYERRRARFVAEIEQRDRPPYTWRIQAAEEGHIVFEEGLAQVLNRLRLREGAATGRLAINPTVHATVRHAGRATFVFQQQTRPPEYLLLIDRYDPNDHRAQLFDALYQEMERAEVLIARFFYQGDPQVCFNEDHPNGLSLAELAHRHRDARLLVVGDGARLLLPSSRQPAPWTRMFEGWTRRALLLTSPTHTWGRRENTLASLFHLAPASLQGLDLVLEHFETLEERPVHEALQRITDAIAEPIAFKGSLQSTLRRYFPDERLRYWIAACAVYPALHWDLTLYLGRELPSILGNEAAALPLLTAAHLRQLARLPWFIEGRIPESARLQLVELLAADDLELPVRRLMDQLLKQAPAPPQDSVAYDDWRMNVILNELLLQPNPGTRRALEREFGRYLAAGKTPDFVAFKLLERQPTRLDLLAPNSWKKYLFRHGLARFGLRLWPRLVPLCLVLALGIGLAPVQTDVCKGGETVLFEGKNYCLETPEDHLTYLDFLTHEAIEAQNHVRVDSLRRAAVALKPPADTVPYYRNTATYYYNYAARAFNCSRDKAPECADIGADSLRALACDNFRRGSVFYSEVSGGSAYDFYSFIQQDCPQKLKEYTDWCTTVNHNTFEAYRAYLQQYPEGVYFDMAQKRTDIQMVTIAGGTFDMGDVMGDKEEDDETVHKVTVSDFQLAAYELTFEEYDRFCDATGREKPGDSGWGRGRRPVINVSWNDAVAYCNWLSQQHGYRPVYAINGEKVTADWSADGYRLPTEAEWEYAARQKGQKVRFGNGKDIADPKEINFDGSKDYKKSYSVEGEYRGKTIPVGSFGPNSLGLYDMSGNVLKWCWDWYDTYPSSSQTNPKGPNSSSYRVLRGGSWYAYPVNVRCAHRYYSTPDIASNGLGFRIARAAR